jgi:predicted nuclease of predicted toxin-antitoxin system
MSLVEFRILTDENINPALVSFLRTQNMDVVDVKEQRWVGASDEELMRYTYNQNRIIVTHDNDFGKLVFTSEINVSGIIYLRPGHFDVNVSIASFKALLNANIEWKLPFICVAEHTKDDIKIRYRPL